MSYSPYPLLKADAAVQALLGASPRAYPFGEAPQNVAPPYAVWQRVTGLPLNTLDGRPVLESQRLQFDCYASTAAAADAVARAVIGALELSGHRVADNGQTRDAETRLYRNSFDFEFFVSPG